MEDITFLTAKKLKRKISQKKYINSILLTCVKLTERNTTVLWLVAHVMLNNVHLMLGFYILCEESTEYSSLSKMKIMMIHLRLIVAQRVFSVMYKMRSTLLYKML